MDAAIAVANIPNKGRGYIAQRDIKQGEVMLEEHAMKSSAFADQMPPSRAYEELADKLLATPDLRDLLQFDASQGTTEKSKAIAQVKLNSFISRIPTERGDMFTLQLDPKGSFFNHNCFPNAASHLRASGASVTIALSPISKGDEVCICYKTQVLFLPTPRRQELLQRNWGFTCTCARCTHGMPNDTFLTQGNMTPNEAKKMSAEYDELMESQDRVNDYPDAEKWVKKAKDFLQLELHKAHWRKINIRRGLIHFLLNPHFNTKMAPKFIREQIEVFNLIAPALHNCKLELFLTYRQIGGTEWRKELTKFDPNSETILTLFDVI
eukprot:Phypoly_transcript_13014.p1 GENE.Phypoly_transcript_13014~~Phypoly_transcript_13014.p1  ORF type:complete len:362 (-),score=49.00 Phypoly_transcript_13014:7-975(-)